RASCVFLLIAAQLAAPVVAAAQRVPTIGLLSTGTDPIKPNPIWIQFLDQLGQLGYVEGRNIAIERRFAGGRYEGVADFVTGRAGRCPLQPHQREQPRGGEGDGQRGTDPGASDPAAGATGPAEPRPRVRNNRP